MAGMLMLAFIAVMKRDIAEARSYPNDDLLFLELLEGRRLAKVASRRRQFVERL